MKRSLSFLIAVLILLEVGCKPTPMPPVTKPAATGTLKNENGVVIGDIPTLGLKLEVRGVKDGGVGSSQAIAFKVTPSGNSETLHWDIAAGEVQIILDRAGNGPIALKVDNQDFGTFQEGVTLLIDEQRQVFVDGAKRESTK